MGRPRSENPKSSQAGFRATPSECDGIEAAAAHNGKKPGPWLRDLARAVTGGKIPVRVADWLERHGVAPPR